MKHHHSFLVAICLLMLSVSPSTNASLVHISPDLDIGFAFNVPTRPTQVELDTNPVTGDYVVCWYDLFDIFCQVRDSSDALLREIIITTANTDFEFDFRQLDVSIATNSNIYVMWSAKENTLFGNGEVYFQGFDSQGNPLFPPSTSFISSVDDADITVTPTHIWIAGTQRVIEFIESENRAISFSRAFTDIFDLNGNFLRQLVLYNHETNVTNQGSLSLCESSHLSSNRTGDIIVTWVEPNDRRYPLCVGTVYARTFRSNGTPISNRIQVSQSIQNGNGDDISNFRRVSSVAYENGRYAVVWDDMQHTYVANLELNGNIATPHRQILPGAIPRIGGNSAEQHYVVLSEEQTGTCTLGGRIAFNADPDPNATFIAGPCGLDTDIKFLPNGDMLMARTLVVNSLTVRTVINRIGLPAEIEINNVSVLEGDPQRGIGGVAAIEVSLTRPHPGGENIEVSYFSRDNTALVGIDYQLTQGALNFDFSSGQLSQTLFTPIIADNLLEGDEIFDVLLESPINAVIRKGGELARVTIIDDDTTAPISANCNNGDATICREIPEPIPGTSTDILVTLRMASPSDSVVTINYRTRDGSASAGSDYMASSGSVQIPAGGTQANIVLTIRGDNINEDTETFDLLLNADATVNLTQNVLTFHILNESLCSLAVNPNAFVTLAAGSMEQFAVTTLDGCQWDVSTNEPWISIDSPASNTSSGTVNFTVAPFEPPPGVFTRSGIITVTLNDPLVSASIDLIVDQDGNCEFTVDPTSINIAVDGGSGSFHVTASDESCDWDVTSPVDWVVITSPTEPVMGDGDATFIIEPNAAAVNVENPARSVTLNSEEFSFSINQAGCEFNLDRASSTVSADGSEDVEVNVLAPDGNPGVCAWSAVSNASWILIKDGPSGSGGGTVVLDVLDNPSVVARTGTVSIADEIFTIEQSGVPCSYALAPDTIQSCPDGQVFTASVMATAGCSWQLSPQQAWVEVLNNASGLGDENASGVILSNLSEIPRQTTLNLLSAPDNSVVAQLIINQDAFLSYQDFNNGLPFDWSFTPTSRWSVMNGQLRATILGLGQGTALDVSDTCRDCKVEARVNLTTLGSDNSDNLSLVAWFEDPDNQVMLAMNEFANQWRLIQIAGGVTTVATATVDEIVPNRFYTLSLTRDDTNFYASVDGQPVVQLAKQAGTDPIGFAGIHVVNNNALVDEFRITGASSDFNILFRDGFEVPQTLALSSCTQ